MSNRSAKDILKLLTETSDGVMIGNKRMDPGFVNPSKFGNWVLESKVEAKQEDGATYTVALSPMEHGQIRVVMRAGPHSSSTRMLVDCRFNDDTGSASYEKLVHTAGQSHSSAIYDGDSYPSMLATDDNDYSASLTELIISRAASTQMWTITGTTYVNHASVNVAQYFAGEWRSTDALESITFYERFEVPFDATFEVYRWQEIVPAELHSYELMAKYDLNNEVLDDSLLWDGNLYEECTIVSNISGPGEVGIHVNGDSGNNYARAIHYGGAAHGSSSQTAIDRLMVAEKNSPLNKAVVTTKKGSVAALLSAIQYTVGEQGPFSLSYTSAWKNMEDVVQSMHIISSAPITGHVRVYRLVPTHLMCSNPGMLNGMWQRTLNATEIEVQPGEIEIGGTICSLRAPRTVSLNTDLRDGESIVADTYYWLYAVKNGTDVQFELSSEPPSVDRYGNVNTDIRTQYPECSWHPAYKVSTHRYIGQVLTTDDVGSVLSFSYCSPARWESAPLYVTTTTYTDVDIAHSAGYAPAKPIEGVVSEDGVTLWANIPQIQHYVDKYYGAYFRRNITDRGASLCLGASPFLLGGDWTGNGYVKMIVNK